MILLQAAWKPQHRDLGDLTISPFPALIPCPSSNIAKTHLKLHPAYRTKLPNILDFSTMSRQESSASEKFSEPVTMSQSPHAHSARMIIPQSHGVTIQAQASATGSKLMNLIEKLCAHNRTRRLGRLVNNSHPLFNRFYLQC